MIAVVFENNEIYRNDALLEQLFARHVELKEMVAKVDSLCLIRLHKEETSGAAERVDLTGWKEQWRKLYYAMETDGYNYSIICFDRKRDLSLQLSVVLSTCNQPEWLEKVLWGYEAQIDKRFELIIADDGSRWETYDMLQRLVPQLSFPVKHVWHEDKGFRKCDILNKGILATQTDYLLFSDGDCIPRNDFVATHLQLRRKGRFLSGGYHKLSIELSGLLTKEDILAGRCFDLSWMRDKGMPASFKNNKLTATGFKRWALNTFTPTKATWNGHNASGWLSDILAVNGFDERMQYGGQDREFGERLENYGVHGMQIRYSTVCLHLDHARGYKTQESIQKNRNIRKHTRGAKVQWSPYGIVKEPLAGVTVKANSYYDRYTLEEERLAVYRHRGGINRHLISLPCQWRKNRLRNKVIEDFCRKTESPVLSNHSGVIVSLTSFPPRIGQLHLVLRSILWQTCPPEKIVVWLSEEEFPNGLAELPERLTVLTANGVEFRFVPENIRGHKKYYYVFREYPDNKVITMDDDLIYPRDAIERLLALSYQYPKSVCGNVIRKIAKVGNRFLAYKEWEKVVAMSPEASNRNMAVGCGGICYPSRWYDDTLFDLQLIKIHSPFADDLWLKANELRLNVKVAGGGNFYPRPIELPGTQSNSLQRRNNGKSNLNDEQWAALNRIWKLDELDLEA